ncbi:uncharacterized protein DS421_1g16310 [Arachis hypogaea]|nr:uncharacterized protein DS421_1g16310 [Arachis hypogaea]
MSHCCRLPLCRHSPRCHCSSPFACFSYPSALLHAIVLSLYFCWSLLYFASRPCHLQLCCITIVLILLI